MSSNTLEDVFTVEDLAKRYGKTERTIRRLINKGEFPGAKRTPQRWIIIPLSAVQAYEARAVEYRP
ncbi:helix-turn-helix domain-containing protein [uncultured Actinomyces sp.]|uniref:helix-turn-helix domain-containing protein n=1 Tax=uncultured Actinomyces sp. TaxID=249061 RepID=UPI0026275C37|nr:helix-turn-helix domain-containing protein [uncultured Actinomyces sp.]